MEETDIVRKCQIGHTECFDELYMLYAGRAIKSAYFLSGNMGTAEDIVQEAFTEAYLRIKTLKKPENFYRWFYSILIRTSWKVIAKAKKVFPVENVFETTVPYCYQQTVEEAIEVREASEKIRNALNSLSMPLRTVVLLYYYNDMSVKDIAKITGSFQGTVKSRLHTARALIKKSLYKSHDEELFGLAPKERRV